MKARDEMARPRKVSADTEVEPVTVVADEPQEQPADAAQPAQPEQSATVTVSVKPSCRWFSVQSSGWWFSKSSPQVVSRNEPRLAEWRANSLLVVEE